MPEARDLIANTRRVTKDAISTAIGTLTAQLKVSNTFKIEFGKGILLSGQVKKMETIIEKLRVLQKDIRG